MVTMPGIFDADGVIARERRGVARHRRARTSGRMPANTLSTSARVGVLRQVERRRLQDELDLLLHARPVPSVASAIGVSVVPTSVWPCHGMANITRPSLVCGTMMALSPGRNEPSKTRWMPWLGAIIGCGGGVRHAPHAVGEGAGGVDHDLAARVELLAGLCVAHADAVDEAFGVLGQAGDRA